MALSIASTSTYSDPTGSTSHILTLPSGTAAGDLVRIFFAAHSTPTVTDPSGWAVLVTKVNNDTYRIYAKIVDASDVSTGTVTVGLSGTQRASGVLERITGARNGVTSSEIAVSSAVDANTATPDPPSLNPGWGAEEILYTAATFAPDGGFTFNSYPSGYTLGQNNVQTGSGTGNAISVASNLLTASSEDPGTFSTTTSRLRSTYTLAVRPAVTALSLSGDAGSYTFTGQAANLEYGREVAGNSGSYALTGTAASLEYGREVAGNSGAYAFTGTSADLVISAEKVILADSGVYAWSGQAASLEVGRILTADGSSYSWSGQAASLEYGFEVEGQSGSYSLTGATAQLLVVRSVTATSGAYLFTGSDATLEHLREIAASSGLYAFTGSEAAFITGGTVNMTISVTEAASLSPSISTGANMGGSIRIGAHHSPALER